MNKRLLFYFALLLLVATELCRMYLLSPVPGSQQSEMVGVSFFLWKYRWAIRIVALAGIAIGLRTAFEKRKWVPAAALLIAGIVFYMVNFKMSADNMFHEPETLQFASADSCGLPDDALLISVSYSGETHAYPIRYLAYHHKVEDRIGGKAVMVSYCNVCRSALAFDPVIDGQQETFRLVGMDRFNAMIEDHSTGSWWQQATGECVAGARKGQQLEIIPAMQVSLEEWKKLFPAGKVMLPDAEYAGRYSDDRFEKGTSTSTLVGTDTASWRDKSWVVGVELNGRYRAYDWNALKRERIIYDTLAGEKVIMTIDVYNRSYEVVAYSEERSTKVINGDTVLNIGYHPGITVRPLAARQMFWHTWRTFYPQTTQYPR